MSEFDPTPDHAPLDPESAVLHALAILQRGEALMRSHSDAWTVECNRAANGLMHWWRPGYWQLGNAIDEATGLGNERAEKRREKIDKIIVGLGSGTGYFYPIIGIAPPDLKSHL